MEGIESGGRIASACAFVSRFSGFFLEARRPFCGYFESFEAR